MFSFILSRFYPICTYRASYLPITGSASDGGTGGGGGGNLSGPIGLKKQS